MSAAALIFRIILASIIAITVGVIGWIGFMILEPFSAAFGNPPSSLGWGTGQSVLMFVSFAIIGLLIVLVVWFVVAPARRDARQQFQ